MYTDPAGIEARLQLDGAAATLTVRNDTDAVLARPGVYVLDARDGSKVRWRIAEAVPVPAGERMAFTVTRSPVPEAKHIGLVAMLFGGKDYGAFTPPQAGSA